MQGLQAWGVSGTGSRVLSSVWQGLGFSGVQVAVKIKVLRAIEYLVPHYENYGLNLVPRKGHDSSLQGSHVLVWAPRL